MSKRRKGAALQEIPAPAPAGMSIDAILAQFSSLKDNARFSIRGQDPDADAIWQADIEAYEAATAILSALQDEGIGDSEQVRDLIHDYNALAQQYQALHRKHEAAEKPEKLGNIFLCPDCHRKIRFGNAFCWNCGKRLDWDRR